MGWQLVLALGSMALLMVLSISLVWAQRDALLDRAQAQAQREVLRLGAELDQSLRLARASMSGLDTESSAPGAGLSDSQRPLILALDLPFALKELPVQPEHQEAPERQWLPGLPRQDNGQWIIPMVWRQSAAEGGRLYELQLAREALLARFASEGMPKDSSMSLFRIEDDGATTVLSRHPLVEKEQGMKVHGHLSAALNERPSGVFRATAVVDGIERIVGYQRLAGDAQRLMVVYALGTEGVLAPWKALLPWAGLLTFLVMFAMGYGTWRLQRSMRALHDSERHFQTLASHLPDVIARYDRQGRFLYVNPAVESANGRSPEALIGKTITEVGTPEPIAAEWMASLDRVFTSGLSETLYFSYPGPKGMRHWEAQVSLEPAGSGETQTVLVINRDITERREAQARTQAAQHLFETVFQAAPEAMSLADWHTGQLLLVNDAFCELFGRTREHLLGRTSLELGLWRSSDRRHGVLAALERGEQVRNVGGISTRPDGQQIHMRYSAEQVMVDGQRRLLLLFRDMTQLEKEQAALARSELRFRLAAAQGQVWEWNFGDSDSEVHPSDEFFVELGHPSPPKDQMAAAFLDLIHPEDLPRLRLTLNRFFKGHGPYRLEFRARDASGRYRWFDTRGSGLRDATGRLTYMAGTTFEITDRKELEQAQRQTLKQLETIANASPALFWSSDTQGRFDWFNQSWLDFTGRTLNQETGKGWLDGVHPDDLAQGAAIYGEAFDAREAFQMEYRLRRHDGQFRWMLVHGKPRYDADNRFIGYIGSCLDVSDLKQAENTAQERGALIEQVFDVLQDMLFVVNADERYVFFQAGRSDRLLMPPAAFLGRQMSDVMPENLASQFRSAMQMARQAGLQELDYQLELPDGTHHFNTRLAWLPEGRLCMFLVRDVTVQQNAVQDRERLNRFVLMMFRLASRFINLPLDQMDAAIDEALGDMGQFVAADRAYLFVYDHEASTASNTHEWCAEGVSPQKDMLQNLPLAMIPDWIDTHRRGQRMHVPDVRDLPPGALRDLLEPQDIRSLMTLPLMAGDECLGFVGLDSVNKVHHYIEEEVVLLELFAQMLVNMRLRTQVETRVRELTGQLEVKVRARTAELEDTVRRLQTANRELETFTYSASHDLRTPLRGIEGFSTLLLQEHASQLDNEGREYLQRIQRATLHMSQLITDLLAYARLEEVTGQVQPVLLAPLVEAVAAPFLEALKERQGHLTTEIPPTLAVMADEKGLSLVLRNLMDNALKFTPPDRHPEIRISATPDGAMANLSVSDNGQGFDMKYHDRIFGMFQRLHRQDQIPGTGIGLALVAKAVQRMGGQIRADSTPGVGSTFHVGVLADPASVAAGKDPG